MERHLASSPTRPLCDLRDEVEGIRALYEGAKDRLEQVRRELSLNPFSETAAHTMQVHDTLLILYNHALREYNRSLVESIQCVETWVRQARYSRAA